MHGRAKKYALVKGEALERMAKRFQARLVKLPTGCWRLSAEGTGYETVTIPGGKGSTLLGHIFSFRLARGRWPRVNAQVCHRCANRFCVNPDHVYEGTAMTNSHDRWIAQHGSVGA